MILAIKIPVVVDDGEDEDKELSFEKDLEDDLISISLDGKEICRGDYSNNFKLAFEEVLERFK